MIKIELPDTEIIEINFKDHPEASIIVKNEGDIATIRDASFPFELFGSRGFTVKK